MSAQTRGMPSTRTLSTLVHRAGPPTVALLLAPLVALGAIAHPVPSLATGAGTATFAAAVVGALRRARIADLPPVTHPAVAAVSAAPLPAAVAGTAAVDLLPYGLLAASLTPALVVGWWCGTVPQLRPHGRPPTADEEPSRTGPADLLGVLPVEVLFTEWREVTASTCGRTSDPGDGDRWRCALIGEFQRRDAEGTARWLAAGPGAPPERFIDEVRHDTRG